MKDKIKIAIIYGGRSAEHSVSIASASQLLSALDAEKYDPLLIHINPQGRWILQPTCMPLLNHISQQQAQPLQKSFPEFASATPPPPAITLLPDFPGQLINLATTRIESEIDVVFPLVHGSTGEDGTLQGFLKIANVPFVGCDVISSAIAMDKDISKSLLRAAGIPVAKHVAFSTASKPPAFSDIADTLGIPFFVKPANMGSSIGISRVDTALAYRRALLLAKHFDTKIVLEECLTGREIECAIIGNDSLWVSPLGEVHCHGSFYDYEAKYWNTDTTQLTIPAKLDTAQSEQIKTLAEQAYKALNCNGMARVDFFVGEQQVWVNEINTLPGLTPQSMFPKLWESVGISLSDVVDKLVELGLESYRRRSELKTAVDCFE